VGQKVFEQKNGNNTLKVDVSILAKGVYLVKLHRERATIGAISERVNFDAPIITAQYFYNIIDENSLIRANGQFVKN
jgi:hypothetical protein